MLLNEMMKVERSRRLRAGPHERSEQRQGHANGYKSKRVRTRVGELDLAVPQTRASDFYPSCLEKGLKSERALRLALAEAYVQGVSTRKMAKLTQELCGIELFVSDAHEGLKAARKVVFPAVPWQRCQFHVQQNVQKYVPRQSMKREVAEAIRGVFNALNREEADRQLDRLIQAYQDKAPKLAAWAGEAISEALTVFAFPEAHRRRIRTGLPQNGAIVPING